MRDENRCRVWTPRRIARRCGLGLSFTRRRIRQAVERRIVPEQTRPIAYNEEEGARLIEFIESLKEK